MKVILKKTSELTPYDNNPRINDEAVEYVAKSIKEFGFKVPIVVDANNVIITGHTRLKAAEQLSIEEVPVIVADDLSDEQIKAFRLADNKVAEIAEWDEELLAIELEELENLDFDMNDFGFEDVTSDFKPVDETEQPDLSELEPKMITCPCCGERFDLREVE